MKEFVARIGVFSAYAEVFLKFLKFEQKRLLFSPRTRRCFYSSSSTNLLQTVFSAYAEVFPKPHTCSIIGVSFLRVRGGVSGQTSFARLVCKFSPRKRRCFRDSIRVYLQMLVFSAQAEVFPPK